MTSPLQGNLMAMGWYMRRTADSHALGDFYREVIGLPVLRGGRPWTVTMFWAGEATVFELKSDEAPMPERDRDPDTAPCTPIFRAHGLDGLLQRLADAGVRILREERSPTFRQAFVLDSDDQLMLFRETPRTAGSAIDREAWRRFDTGNRFQPVRGAKMPGDIQCLDGILMRARDFTAMHSFYREVIGLEEAESDTDRAVFHLGDNTFLELRPGGRLARMPEDRVEVTNSFILRLQDTERFKTSVKERNVHFVNEHIQWKRAHLAYFSDPEGRITGIEQRYAPENFLEPVEAYPEDLEAERRFAERA
ncbi:MAG: hypothetical protein F4X96_02330 [Gammaproteobacteria bacterium]|nr:hypothetical protein [Chromatiales bacterium]MYE48253.1 hypothetical protein [Gammaproteobacteria bacterium]